MDFITGPPKSKKKNDSIFVVVDKLSKATHFIPVKWTYKEVHIADIFLKEIFRLHRIPKEIILDRDAKLIGNFWRSLFSRLETQLNFSTAYHPWIRYSILCTDSQGKQVKIQGTPKKVSVRQISNLKVKKCVRKGYKLFAVNI